MAQLAYQIPSGGRRRAILRIPESHDLHLCPNSCGRRQGIRALKNGEADHASFLSFSQADVALGDYVRQIDDAVDAVLARVSPRPRVLRLHVNCIDDFLGTDTDALLAGLAQRHPDVTFLLARLNPIAEDVRGGESPAQAVQSGLYAPLVPVAPQDHDAGINVVGTFARLPQGSEVYDVLAALGTRADEVRDLLSCPTFADYQLMARSRLTLSVGHLGDTAAADMEGRLGIPWMAWPACYDLDEISRRYGRLADLLGAGASDVAEQVTGLLAEARAKAEAALSRAREVLGDMPLYVDTSASLMPFSLACTLLECGFNVRAVFALHSKGWDDDARHVLEAAHPDVLVITSQGIEAIQGFDLPREAVSVGRDAAFLVRANHVADLYHDEGHFGFDGVARLADLLAESLSSTKEWGA
ncbi:MAG: nitrogen fixation protein NifE [Coriobacteriia bacterium]|nr:nitrogen fixation protein NifE [Coriobacteriia bacterium]MBS5478994.1 nitrogen fixation protein NifE [Coriobacteriia bacterium]